MLCCYKEKKQPTNENRWVHVKSSPSRASLIPKASSSRFTRYAVEVQWRTKKSREVIDYCLHLRSSASRQACCKIMKKDRRQKNTEERIACKKSEETKRKNRTVTPPPLMGLVSVTLEKEKKTDQEKERMTRSDGEIQEGMTECGK